MIPIGRGQRELIIGDRQTGKTAIARRHDHQPEGPERELRLRRAIGQKQSTVASVGRSPAPRTARWSTPSSSPPPRSERRRCSSSRRTRGVTHGRVLPRPAAATRCCVYDDLGEAGRRLPPASRCCSAARRAARRTRATCSTSTAACSSARASSPTSRGRGSLTALPIIETQAGDVSAYIPTNVISITDGQIFLEVEPLLPGHPSRGERRHLGVARVGGAAQVPAMRRYAGPLRLYLAQYRELGRVLAVRVRPRQGHARHSGRGQRLAELLKQDQYQPLSVARRSSRSSPAPAITSTSWSWPRSVPSSASCTRGSRTSRADVD